MITEVLLPQWGMAMQEATILEWLKSEGETVTEDEDLVEVEAEKANAAVVAPVSGVLREIRVKADETVEVGAVLAIIESSE